MVSAKIRTKKIGRDGLGLGRFHKTHNEMALGDLLQREARCRSPTFLIGDVNAALLQRAPNGVEASYLERDIQNSHAQ